MKEQSADRIGRFLAGEMDEQERRAFEQEIASDPDLNESFLAYQQIWQTKLATPEDRWDAELGWVEFEKRNLDPVPVSKTRRIVLYWAIAASVLLVLGFTYFYFLTPSPKTYLYADQQGAAIELKDGSKIYLNKGGAVTVYSFTRKARHVELSGEAYFEISHDVNRPFTIACGGTVTQVVGTAFTIRQVKDEVRLSVQTGKVIFRIKDDPHEALALVSGEAADFKGHHLQMVPNPSPNVSAWHTRQLQFANNMPLTEVIHDIGEYFGATIIIDNPAVNNCRIQIPLPFKDPEINKVLKAVARTINAQVEQVDQKFVLKGGNCS